MNTRSIVVGKDALAPFMAYGDDSQYNGVLVFAYVIVRRTKVRRAIQDINAIKEKFRFPESTKLHCRTLFSGQQRTKSGLPHLEPRDTQSIIHHAITLINQHDIFLRYAFARYDNSRDIFGGSGEVTLHDADSNSKTLTVSYDPKALLGLLAQSCFANSPDGSHGPTAEMCEIYAAQDPTKVHFVGEKRQRADSLVQGHNNIGAPQGAMFHVQPKVAAPDFSPLFELADIASYVCSHAMHGKEQEPFFADALSRVKYSARTEHFSGREHPNI